MPKGTIRRLITDRGFGFIKTEQGEDAFFHRNDLQGVGYNSLVEGQEVEYEVGQGRDGRSQAVKVRLAVYQAQPDEPEEVATEEGPAIEAVPEEVADEEGPAAEAVPEEVADEGESTAEADTDNL